MFRSENTAALAATPVRFPETAPTVSQDVTSGGRSVMRRASIVGSAATTVDPS